MTHYPGEPGLPAWADGIDAALPTKLDVTAAAAMYAPVAGNRTVFLGDSITAGSDLPAIFYQSISWPTYATMMSGQRIHYTRNAGVPGNTTAAMLARFDTDVTPYSPDVVTLLCGTNDIALTPLAAWTSTVQDVVAKIQAIHARPVLCTLPPTNTATSKRQLSIFNGWLRRYAATSGLALIDFYTLLADPATSDYKAAYLNDGTHPNPAGFLAMGNLASTVLSPIINPGSVLLADSDVSQISSVDKGCFGGYTGNVVPGQWFDNAGVPSGSTLSYTTDTAVPGQMLTITSAATTGPRQLAYTQYFGTTTVSTAAAAGATTLYLAGRADSTGVLFIGSGSTYEVARCATNFGGGPQTTTLIAPLKFAHAVGEPVIVNGLPGDEMIFSGVVTTDGGVAIGAKVNIPGASFSPGFASLTGAITRGVFHFRFTFPSGGTSPLGLQIQAGAGTGVVSWGQVGFFNATRQGI